MPWVDSVQRCPGGLVPGSGGRQRDRVRALRRHEPVREAAGDVPEARLADVPASTAAQWPGVNGQVQYSEGLGRRLPLVRLAAHRAAVPVRLRPVLHDVPVQPPGGRSGQPVAERPPTVTADITNTGRRAGADVVQLYLGEPAAATEPPQQLKGFQKVQLNRARPSMSGSRWTAVTCPTGTPTRRTGRQRPGSTRSWSATRRRTCRCRARSGVTTTTGPRYVKVTAPAHRQRRRHGDRDRRRSPTAARETVRDTSLALSAPAGWQVAQAGRGGDVGPGKSVTASGT